MVVKPFVFETNKPSSVEELKKKKGKKQKFVRENHVD